MGRALRSAGGTLKIRRLSATGISGNSSWSARISAAGIPGYQRLTVDNFYIVRAGLNPKSTEKTGYLTRSYDAGTGMLTVTISAGTSISLYNEVEVVCVTVE